MTEELLCDDMMEGPEEYCAFDHKYCDENRMNCKKADDYYYKKDGKHYYQRFVVLRKRVHNIETNTYDKEFFLKDLQGKFKDVSLKDYEDANSLIYFLYELCDKIDELGGYSECLNHK